MKGQTVKFPLVTVGYYTLIDADDLSLVSKYRWYICRRTNNLFYVQGPDPANKNNNIKLHRLLMSPPPGKEIDHINGDGLDNRRCNLRIVSHSENVRNERLRITNNSGFPGVHLNKIKNIWVARASHGKTRIYLGASKNKNKAVELVKEWKLANWGSEYTDRLLEQTNEI